MLHESLVVGSGKSGWAGHSTVESAAHEIVGEVVSRTEIVWLHEAVLPHASVAVQTRRTADTTCPPVAQLPARAWSADESETVLHESLVSGVGKTG